MEKNDEFPSDQSVQYLPGPSFSSSVQITYYSSLDCGNNEAYTTTAMENPSAFASSSNTVFFDEPIPEQLTQLQEPQQNWTLYDLNQQPDNVYDSMMTEQFTFESFDDIPLSDSVNMMDIDNYLEETAQNLLDNNFPDESNEQSESVFDSIPQPDLDIDELAKTCLEMLEKEELPEKNVNRRQKRGDEQPPDYTFRCEPCDRTFKKLCYKKQHESWFHNGELPFKCDTCGKRYRTVQELDGHVPRHDPVNKNSRCAACGRSYNSDHDLNKHVKRTHLSEKPYACDLGCGQRFVRRDQKVKHEGKAICRNRKPKKFAEFHA